MLNQETIFRQYLKSKGLKFTPERKKILEGAFCFSGHFDAEELYHKLHVDTKTLSLATVYRTIPHLVASGLIKEALHSHNGSQYEKKFGRDHHDHLICIKCGRILEFKNDSIEQLQDKVCRKHGFEAVEYRLRIRGYCKSCQGKINKNK